ncbi:MAG: hypothetical protein M1404_04025 [Acidobacteria bacterium]|nr:hypothetical protein [Acidobacteriota bacterium]
MPTCPECDVAIDIEEEDLEEGQIVECPECGAELEVVSTNPLEFDLVKDEEEKDDEEEAW